MLELHDILAVTVGDIICEQVVSLAVLATTIHFDVASLRGLAQVGQLREVLPAHHEQIQLFDHFNCVDLLALYVFPVWLLFAHQADPEQVAFVGEDGRGLFVHNQQRSGQVYVFRINGIVLDDSLALEVCH